MKKIHESKNNKKFNATINKIHEEIKSAKTGVCDWHLRWRETYSDVYCYDLQFLLEDEVAELESKYELMYDLSRYWDDSKREGQAIERITLEADNGEEYICEFRKLDWLLSNSKIARSFSFINTGEIAYSQMKRKRKENDQSYDYYAAYNVNDSRIFIRFKNSNTDVSFINSNLRQYSFDNKIIAEDEECITLIENKNEQSRLEIEIDRAGKVLRKYLSLGDYHYVIEGNEIVSAFVGETQLEIDDEMSIMLNYALSQFDIGNIEDNKIFDYINEVKIKVINAIKGIKGDVPMDGLLKRLDIALSMISTKRLNPSEPKKELRKK